jgi:acyl-CoA synthetase (NDP forming)
MRAPLPTAEVLDGEKQDRIRALIDGALAGHDGTGSVVLDEIRSRELLEIVGVPNSPGGFADGDDAAVAIATRVGYPVVLKGVVPGLAHKSDVGAVALKLSDESALRTACENMRASLAGHGLVQDLAGFLVCRMEKPGFEAIIGASRDAMFGPTFACGAGGTAVEQLNDIVLRLAPGNREELKGELTKLKVWNHLAGGRGAKARDVDGLVDAALAIARLIDADPRIAEIDVNPLLVGHAGEGVIALDALLTIQPAAA